MQKIRKRPHIDAIYSKSLKSEDANMRLAEKKFAQFFQYIFFENALLFLRKANSPFFCSRHTKEAISVAHEAIILVLYETTSWLKVHIYTMLVKPPFRKSPSLNYLTFNEEDGLVLNFKGRVSLALYH